MTEAKHSDHAQGTAVEQLHPYWFSKISRHITNTLQGVISSLSWIFFVLFADVTIEGKNNLKIAERYKREGGKIVIGSNHMGDIDVLLLRGMFHPFSSPLTPLRTVSLQKKYYKNFGFFRNLFYTEFVFKLLGAYPAYVGHKDYAFSLRSHYRFLMNNETVCIFPEGKSTKNGRIGECHGGIGYLARESGAAILPITISGAWKVKPFAFFLRRHHFVVHIGELITPEEISTYPDTVEGYKGIAQIAMKQISFQFERIRKDHPTSAQVLFEDAVAADFGGEHRKKSFFMVLMTYIVGYWCMISNVTKILYFKHIYRRNKTFNEVLWELGRSVHHGSSIFLDVLSPWNHSIKVKAASWQSLEPFYDYHSKTVPEHHQALKDHESSGLLKKFHVHTSVFLSKLWMGNAHNRQALRNRLLLSVKYLQSMIESYPKDHTITLLSIASGSARAVIEAITQYPERSFRIVLIDLDPAALEYAKRVATEHGVAESFTYIHSSSSHIDTLIQNGEHFDIVEMVGFLDYRNKEKATSLIKKIKQVLVPGGAFLCANIQPNSERVLLDWGLLWPMIYRTDTEYYDVLRDAGFRDEDISLSHEPFKIHIISIAKNSN